MAETRQQQMLSMALNHVSQVKDEYKGGEVARIYGGLCHKFPVMIRTCGLCQAAAFIESKEGKDDRGKAHIFIRKHALEVLKKFNVIGNASNKLSDAVRNLDTANYLLATRLITRAWIYYKRFAESILGVESAQGAEDAGSNQK